MIFATLKPRTTFCYYIRFPRNSHKLYQVLFICCFFCKQAGNNYFIIFTLPLTYKLQIYSNLCSLNNKEVMLIDINFFNVFQRFLAESLADKRL